MAYPVDANVFLRLVSRNDPDRNSVLDAFRSLNATFRSYGTRNVDADPSAYRMETPHWRLGPLPCCSLQTRKLASVKVGERDRYYCDQSADAYANADGYVCWRWSDLDWPRPWQRLRNGSLSAHSFSDREAQSHRPQPGRCIPLFLAPSLSLIVAFALSPTPSFAIFILTCSNVIDCWSRCWAASG